MTLRQPCMLGVNTIEHLVYLKMELSFQRGEMLLFLTTNMAAVMSRANQVVYRYSQ